MARLGPPGAVSRGVSQPPDDVGIHTECRGWGTKGAAWGVREVLAHSPAGGAGAGSRSAVGLTMIRAVSGRRRAGDCEQNGRATPGILTKNRENPKIRASFASPTVEYSELERGGDPHRKSRFSDLDKWNFLSSTTQDC